MEKKLLGTLYGSGNPARTVPLLFAMWRRGVLDLESMVSFRRPLGEINDGFDDLRAGRGIRTVLSLNCRPCRLWAGADDANEVARSIDLDG